DLGGLLGSAAFHSGRALGVPGFDVGVLGTVQSRPDKDDGILRGAGVKHPALPLVQAEVGLPFNLGVIVHGVSGYGARIYGGGVSWGLHKSDKLSPLPDVTVSAFGDKVNQTYFNASHYSLNACASVGLPIFKPYVGAGWDYTEVHVGAAATPGVAGMSATARGSRFAAGVDISPVPLAHLFGAYTVLHGIPGVDAGFGLRF
ncbi:MAG TPA: hypothetical protein VNI01_10990, partial [Elusimicrobiota bacterium]|nr:hypothetical protein [Elusimicrobiota bacterium]